MEKSTERPCVAVNMLHTPRSKSTNAGESGSDFMDARFPAKQSRANVELSKRDRVVLIGRSLALRMVLAVRLTGGSLNVDSRFRIGLTMRGLRITGAGVEHAKDSVLGRNC